MTRQIIFQRIRKLGFCLFLVPALLVLAAGAAGGEPPCRISGLT